MKKLIYIMTIAASLIAATASAQEDDAFMDQIIEQLSGMDASEVTQAMQQIERAKAQLEQVGSKQAQADKLRAAAKSAPKGTAKKKNKEAAAIEAPLYAQRVSAYNIYEKANASIYGIFANNILELASAGPSSVASDVRDLTTFATDSWNKAAKALKTVPTGKKADQKEVATIKQDVNKSQLSAIRYQTEAYKLLLATGDNSHSNDAEETIRMDVVDTENEIDEVEKAISAATRGVGANGDTMDDEGFNFVQGTNSGDRVIYKVQIAADANPLSISKLRKICPTDDIINNELKNGIYRYTIGYYTSYDEAKSMAVSLRAKGVDGAFVVAYKNGERIKEIRDVYNN